MPHQDADAWMNAQTVGGYKQLTGGTVPCNMLQAEW